jgi:hypothetical protein
MEWLLGLGIMAVMTALRLAVPVAIMAAFVYGVRRLDMRLHPTPVQ